jgi:hypothetical protein
MFRTNFERPLRPSVRDSNTNPANAAADHDSAGAQISVAGRIGSHREAQERTVAELTLWENSKITRDRCPLKDSRQNRTGQVYLVIESLPAEKVRLIPSHRALGALDGRLADLHLPQPSVNPIGRLGLSGVAGRRERLTRCRLCFLRPTVVQKGLH